MRSKLTQKFTLTVGIPAYNEEGNIRKLLSDLAGQNQKGFILTNVIVCSDCSTDRTAAIAREFPNLQVQVLENKKRLGKAASLNRIISETHSDGLVIIDADTTLGDSDFLNKLTDKLVRNQADLCAANVGELQPTNFLQRTLAASMDYKREVFAAWKNGNNVYTCHGRCRAFSRKLYEAIEFKESANEDAYSYLYCSYHGFRYLYVPEAIVWYQLPQNLRDHELQSVRFFQSRSLSAGEFGEKFVNEAYALPKLLAMIKLVTFLTKNFYIVPYLLFSLYLSVKSRLLSPVSNTWEVAKSSKSLTGRMEKELTICVFGNYDPVYTSNKLTIAGLRDSGARVVEVNAPVTVTTLNKKTEMGWWPLAQRVLRKYRIVEEIIRHRADIAASDVIYVGYPGHFDVFPAWVVAKLFRKKLVFNPLLIFYTGFTEEQGILSKGSLLGKLAKIGESWAYSICDLVIADTPFQQEFMERIFKVPKSKIRTVALGADDKFYPHTSYTNLSHKIKVTYYGLYSPIHGVDYIVEAARRLRHDPDIHFDMIGNRGQTFDVNLQRVKDLKLQNMSFYYDIPQEQHIPIAQKADIFFGFLAKHPSIDRVIPNKVYQGLSLNKVVMTADAPVIRSVFTHKNNIYIVPPADVDTLVAAIIELKNNPGLRKKIAESGYKMFTENFSPKVVGARIIGYIREIL